MANDSVTQAKLAADPHFQTRLKAAFRSVAVDVLFEDPGTTNHTARATFATTVLGSDDQANQVVTQFAPLVALRGNLIAFETSYDFTAQAFVTTSADADIKSQIHTDWDILTATFRS